MDDIQIKVPPLGESVSSAVIAKWYKKVGEEILENDVVVELETDKVTLEVNAPATGILQQVSFSEGDTVNIGDVVGVIKEGPVSKAAKVSFAVELAQDIAAPPSEKQQRAPAPPLFQEIMAAPSARKLMVEAGIQPSDMVGTGRDGRILKEDVLAHKAQPAQTVTSPVQENPMPPQSATEKNTSSLSERKPLSPLRRKIAERLKYAQNTAAILTTFNECDMSTVMALRKTHQEEFVKKHGTKLGFMSFFVKACVQALKDIPAVNGEIDGDEIVYHKRYDIGIAVSAPSGLVVPVLRGADDKGLHEIEQAIAAFADKAKTNKFSMQDLTGGTFTISNGGTFGSLVSTPILNPPQSGILGMHKIQERPIAMNGQIVIRPMMYLALSYDHRMIDGREAVTFLVKVKEYIENPTRILLGL